MKDRLLVAALGLCVIAVAVLSLAPLSLENLGGNGTSAARSGAVAAVVQDTGPLDVTAPTPRRREIEETDAVEVREQAREDPVSPVRIEDAPASPMRRFWLARLAEVRAEEGAAGADVESAVEAAAALMKLGRYDDAEDALREVLATRPDADGASLLLGELLEIRGRYGQALAQYARVLARSPDRPRARLDALTLEGMLRGRAAVIDGFGWFFDYYNAHSLDDMTAEDVFYIARGCAAYAFYHAETDTLEMVLENVLPEACAKAPHDAAPMLEAARIESARGNLRKAATCIEKAKGIAPNDPAVLVAAAAVLAGAGDDAGALAQLADVFDVNAVHPAALLLAAGIQASGGGFETAGDLLAETTATNPEHPIALAVAAALDAAGGLVDAAERQVDNLAAHFPGVPEALVTYASIVEKAGLAEAAEGALRLAMDLDGRHPAAYRALGALLDRLGRPAEAQTMAAEAARRTP